MGEEIKAGDPAPDTKGIPKVEEIKEQPDAGSPETGNTVKYESLLREQRRRVASDAKAEKLAVENEHLKQAKLEAEGNLAESNERLKKQVEELTKGKKELAGNFAYNSLVSQVEVEAAKLGCIDTEALGQLMDLGSIEVDMETFKADSGELKSAIEQQKKDRPYLFDKKGPKINSSNPSTEFTQNKKDPGQMTVEEQEALARAIDKQEGKTLGW